MLEVEVKSAGQRGRMVTRSGQNVPEAEKLASSISQKPSGITPWLLLNTNKKS